MKTAGHKISLGEKVPGKLHELNLDKLLGTLKDTLQKLENLTTEEYSRGGDQEIRGLLREVISEINKARGNDEA